MIHILRLARYFQLESVEPDAVETIRLKYAEILNSFDFGTRLETGGIYFRSKLSSKNASRNSIEPWKVFQEGDLSIFIKDNKLNINWSVKLDLLYFLSCLIGIAFGFTVSLYFDFTLLQSILSGLAAAIILVIIGVIAIMVKIDELNQVYLEGLLKSKQAI
jgi:hypothetical protein